MSSNPALADAARLVATGALGGGSPVVEVRPDDGPNGRWHDDGPGVVVSLSWRDDGAGEPVFWAVSRAEWRAALAAALEV